MRTRIHVLAAACAAWLLASVLAGAQAPPTSDDPVIAQGQERLRAGDLDAALAAFERAAQSDRSSFQGHLQAGIVLDLLGRYDAARAHLEQALKGATTPDDKTRAQRTMAMSYAFEGKCDGAERYQQPLIDAAISEKRAENAAELSNELARVCLESGSIDKAESWYRKGHDAAVAQPDLAPAAQDLWNFRWEHAQARIAARRGRADEARQHMAAAKALLDKGTNPNQAPFYPYLAGYVAFYLGDYPAALAELQKANDRDPFIQGLLAQTYEKLGRNDEAMAAYRNVLASTAHNPANAAVRPLAQRKAGNE